MREAISNANPQSAGQLKPRDLILIQRRLRRIRDAWQTSANACRASSSAYLRPSSLLKREIYLLAQDLVNKFGNSVAQSLVEQLGHRISAVSDPHVKLFLALLNTIPDVELARTEKHRYAYELTYARRHKVPAELLVGFLLQVGAGKRIKAFVDDEEGRELWYRQDHRLVWVASKSDE